MPWCSPPSCNRAGSQPAAERLSCITSGFILMCLALLQATIGVWTLLLGVPIGLGLAHQAGAMVLFAAALYHLWLSLERRAPAGRTQAAASA